MAHFPKIDCPCPLDVSDQLRVDGHCNHCDKAVHDLNVMDEQQRKQLLAAATGTICVSYRMPVRRAAALGFAMAGVMSASAAAADEFTLNAPTPLIRQETTAPSCDTAEKEESVADHELVTVFVGGVNKSRDEYVLGNTRDASASSESDKLETIVMMGGISQPIDAYRTEDDRLLADIPVVYEDAPRVADSSKKPPSTSR